MQPAPEFIIPGPVYCIGLAIFTVLYMLFFLSAESQIAIMVYLAAGGMLLLLASMSELRPRVAEAVAANQRLCSVLAAVSVLALTALFHEDHYNLFLIGTILLYTVVGLGLNVQLGFTGVINFSCAAFFGIGGYTAAMLLAHTGTPPILCLPLGGAAAAVVGSILLLPVLRTSGHYAALVTMAFALLFRTLLDLNESVGGPQGMAVRNMSLLGWDFGKDIVIGSVHLSFYVSYVLLGLALLCLAFTFTRLVERSWIGLSMDAVRVDETASACFGVNVSRWKITAFTIGNFLSGLAGALYAMMLAYISPANFTFGDSLIFLSILLLGGVGNSWGVVMATVFVVLVPEKFQAIQEYRYLIYSALVLLMIVFRPVGILPRKTRVYSSGGTA